MNTRVKYTMIACLALTVGAVACGKGSSSTNSLGSNLAGSASTIPCVSASDPSCISTAGGVTGICQQLQAQGFMATVGTSANGTSVCHAQTTFPAYLQSGRDQLPRAGTPNAVVAYLKANDVLSVVGSSARYGTYSSCNDYRADGFRSSGSDSAGSGLYGTDGSGQFYVGQNLAYRAVAVDGQLSFGFSTTAVTTNACSSGAAYVTLHRCYDASGAFQRCY